MSIYTNLFRYRPRATRLPQEDFLSEALADLLNRQSIATSSDFIADVLLQEAGGAAAWRDFMSSGSPTLSWKTQHRVPGGTLDLLLIVDRLPAIVVENKIAAAIGMHAPAGTENQDRPDEVVEERRNQLHTYGGWLAGQVKPPGWPGALVLLTHLSPPPDDFGRRR